MISLAEALVFVVVTTFVLGCGGSPEANVRYSRSWVSDPENGLVQVKEVGGLRLTAQFVPVGLLIDEEVQASGGGTSLRDSLRAAYGESVNFIFSYQSRDTASAPQVDVAMQGAGSYQTYAERTTAMNFDMKDQISLKTSAGVVQPVLVVAENGYGFNTGRRLSIAFADPEGKIRAGGSVDLVVHDIVFNTGIHHFGFDGAQIRRASTNVE